jgi:hypothetical protein
MTICAWHAGQLMLETYTQNMQYVMLFNASNGFAIASMLRSYTHASLVNIGLAQSAGLCYTYPKEDYAF